MGKRVLLVDDNSHAFELIEKELKHLGYNIVLTVSTNCDIYEAAKNIMPDLLTITTNSPNETILQQIKYLHKKYPLPTLLFSERADSETIQQATKAGVNAFIVNRIASDRLQPIIDVAIARFNNLKSLKDELDSTKSLLEDRKIIEKAKGILMKERDLSENDAYTALRKMAMNQNIKIGEVAKHVVSVFELVA